MDPLKIFEPQSLTKLTQHLLAGPCTAELWPGTQLSSHRASLPSLRSPHSRTPPMELSLATKILTWEICSLRPRYNNLPSPLTQWRNMCCRHIAVPFCGKMLDSPGCLYKRPAACALYTVCATNMAACHCMTCLETPLYEFSLPPTYHAGQEGTAHAIVLALHFQPFDCKSLPVNLSWGHICIWPVQGFISNADYAGKKTTFILFINGRPVDCNPLKRSIELTYSTVLPKASKPWIFLV